VLVTNRRGLGKNNNRTALRGSKGLASQGNARKEIAFIKPPAGS
jgi:hypothetical protein